MVKNGEKLGDIFYDFYIKNNCKIINVDIEKFKWIKNNLKK